MRTRPNCPKVLILRASSTYKQEVAGSSPALPTNSLYWQIFQNGENLCAKALSAANIGNQLNVILLPLGPTFTPLLEFYPELWKFAIRTAGENAAGVRFKR